MTHKLRCHSCGHIFNAEIGRGGTRCVACNMHLRIKVRARDGDHLETQAPLANPTDADLMSSCGHCGAPREQGDRCGYCGGDFPKSVEQARAHHSAAYEEFAKSNLRHHPAHAGARGGCLGVLVLVGVLVLGAPGRAQEKSDGVAAATSALTVKASKWPVRSHRHGVSAIHSTADRRLSSRGSPSTTRTGAARRRSPKS